MKQITLLLLFSCAFQCLSAQVTWFNPDDRWTFHVISGWVGKGIEQIQYEKDTVIGGLTYKKLRGVKDFVNGVHHDTYRMMRQDGKKIYARSLKVINGKEELLLYDFSLQVGDTLLFRLNSFDEYGYVVTGISSISIGGQNRVKQAVKWLNFPLHIPYQKGTIIEGLGWVEGTHLIAGVDCLSNSYLFLNEPPGIWADGMEQTLCSFQSGATTFEALGNVLCKTLPTNDPLENAVNIYPNPSAGSLYFSSLIPGSEYQVTLYDLAGQQIMQATLNGDDFLTTTFKGTAIVVVQAGGHRMMERVVFL